jgi:hypothetical protein
MKKKRLEIPLSALSQKNKSFIWGFVICSLLVYVTSGPKQEAENQSGRDKND